MHSRACGCTDVPSPLTRRGRSLPPTDAPLSGVHGPAAGASSSREQAVSRAPRATRAASAPLSSDMLPATVLQSAIGLQGMSRVDVQSGARREFGSPRRRRTSPRKAKPHAARASSTAVLSRWDSDLSSSSSEPSAGPKRSPALYPSVHSSDSPPPSTAAHSSSSSAESTPAYGARSAEPCFPRPSQRFHLTRILLRSLGHLSATGQLSSDARRQLQAYIFAEDRQLLELARRFDVDGDGEWVSLWRLT